MINFKILTNNEIKEAFSITEEGSYYFIQFVENGKVYRYNKNNIRILNDGNTSIKPFTLYSFKRECWACNKETEILTYITYYDNPFEDVLFPWDKARLLKSQNIMAHMMDSSIEYYGANVIGDIEEYDKKLMENFPDRIKMFYSKTENKKYPMNACTYCGAKQGRFFVYRSVNEYIKEMIEIPVFNKSVKFGD